WPKSSAAADAQHPPGSRRASPSATSLTSTSTRSAPTRCSRAPRRSSWRARSARGTRTR
ncbi:MAG: RNA polymerase sigma factor RpoD, partial [uncultured Solirubrobacterales bacterium]